MYDLYQEYKDSKYLKGRSGEYITEYIQGFYCVRVGDILAGCMELISTNNVLELGGFAVQTKINVKKQVCILLITTAIMQAKLEGKQLISLTNNERLQELYQTQGLYETYNESLLWRSKLSPGVSIFSL